MLLTSSKVRYTEKRTQTEPIIPVCPSPWPAGSGTTYMYCFATSGFVLRHQTCSTAPTAAAQEVTTISCGETKYRLSFTRYLHYFFPMRYRVYDRASAFCHCPSVQGSFLPTAPLSRHPTRLRCHLHTGDTASCQASVYNFMQNTDER